VNGRNPGQETIVKRLLTLFVALAFVTGLVSLGAAQSSTSEKKAPDTSEKAARPDTKAASKNARGTVKSASADSLVVTGKEKGKEAEWTFSVDPQTKIKKAGKDVSAGDLAAGDAVQVRYTEQAGKMVAQSVTATAGRRGGNPCAAKPAAKNPCAARTDKK
jgi:hypothetical protein